MLAARGNSRDGREVDFGQRCESHVGEVYPPRCSDCDAASADITAGATIDRGETKRLTAIIGRSGYIPSSECPLHANYPLPCDRCKCDLEAVA